MPQARRLLLAGLLLLATGAPAGQPGEQPWMLAAQLEGDPGTVRAQYRKSLMEGPFTLLDGGAAAWEASRLLLTSPELQALAVACPRQPWLAVLPLQFRPQAEQTQIWHPHLPYLARALGHDSGWQALQKRLALALGAHSLHGPALPHTALPSHRYARGFEGVDDNYQLGRHGTQADAIAAVSEKLAAGWQGLHRAYQLTLPHGAELIGLDLQQTDNPDLHLPNWPEQYGLQILLPYPLLIHEARAEAPHLRYWLALFAPELPLSTMLKLGSRSEALEQLLQDLVGGEPADFQF